MRLLAAQVHMQVEVNKGGLFDDWPERYDQWFATPIGKLVQEYEAALLQEMLDPQPGELLLDVGCGTGIFTGAVLASGAAVVGLDISIPMVARAGHRFRAERFTPLAGNMLTLPFTSGSFDKVYSMTALEFVDNAPAAVAELERVAKAGGVIVMSTLNRLSPWAERRLKAGEQGHELFQSMVFRSPAEIRRLLPADAELKTAIHFEKHEDPIRARRIEARLQAEKAERAAEKFLKKQQDENAANMWIAFNKNELTSNDVYTAMEKQQIDLDEGKQLLKSLKTDSEDIEDNPVIVGDLASKIEMGQDVSGALIKALNSDNMKPGTYIQLKKNIASERFGRAISLLNTALKPSEFDQWSPEPFVLSDWISPSWRRTVRLARAATSFSCVTMMMVRPSSFSF